MSARSQRGGARLASYRGQLFTSRKCYTTWTVQGDTTSGWNKAIFRSLASTKGGEFVSADAY
jgi:hypothetical protein